MLVMGLILHYTGELWQVQGVKDEPAVNPMNCDGVD